MGFSSSEPKRLDCTGWCDVLVKWTCFLSCLHGGIGGVSLFLLHKIVSLWMLTAPPLQVFTIPGMKLKAVVLSPEILSPGSFSSAFSWVRDCSFSASTSFKTCEIWVLCCLLVFRCSWVHSAFSFLIYWLSSILYWLRIAAVLDLILALISSLSCFR